MSDENLTEQLKDAVIKRIERVPLYDYWRIEVVDRKGKRRVLRLTVKFSSPVIYEERDGSRRK